jgi:LAO/AO transport system kinase
MDLVNDVLSGSRLALARLLTQVENDTPEGRRALNALFSHTGRAHLIGVTGSPGTGKSSLVGRLAKALRGSGGTDDPRVAIIAVDPTSPFSGGALLGDRVRMRELSGDPGIFIRSMASRGALGGLARSTAAAAQVLDAAGYSIVLIETVGAGQSEVDIAKLAHTVLVVEAPGLGDDIQAIKAGILEIADILVVNKGDLPGADQAVRSLRGMLDLAHPARLARGGCDARELTLGGGAFRNGGFAKNGHAEAEAVDVPIWEPPVLKTSAPLNEGINEVVAAIRRHYQFMIDSGELQRRERERMQNGLDLLLQATLVERWWSGVSEEAYEKVLGSLAQRHISPYEAVEELLKP